MMRLSLLFVVLAACGDDGGSSTPDAPVDTAADASLCAEPTKLCGTTCLAVNEDELNCGDCGIECRGGEACDGTCACPTPFVPSTIEPTSFDQFQGSGGIRFGISPNISGTINPLVVGYDAAAPVLDTDIDLSTIELGEAPFVGAAYRFDLSMQSTDAAYVAVSGTLRLTSACATDVAGTLTKATFRGISGDLQSGDAAVDPQGCTFTVPSLTFHMSRGACP